MLLIPVRPACLGRQSESAQKWQTPLLPIKTIIERYLLNVNTLNVEVFVIVSIMRFDFMKNIRIITLMMVSSNCILCLWLNQDYCGTSQSNGSFRIITENVPCGTTGTTCSKTIKIFLGVNTTRLLSTCSMFFHKH